MRTSNITWVAGSSKNDVAEIITCSIESVCEQEQQYIIRIQYRLIPPGFWYIEGIYIKGTKEPNDKAIVRDGMFDYSKVDYFPSLLLFVKRFLTLI